MGSDESFASVPKPSMHKKLNFRPFVNEEKVDNSDIVLPRDAIDKFAWSLDEINSGWSLKKEVIMAISNMSMETSLNMVAISVEFEWLPLSVQTVLNILSLLG
ncbi:hypothetical protein Tco_0405320 [Tanacetum coccineum]